MAQSKADEYRDKARECEELAQATRDHFIKQQMLEIAEKWRAWRHSKRRSDARPPLLLPSAADGLKY